MSGDGRDMARRAMSGNPVTAPLLAEMERGWARRDAPARPPAPADLTRDQLIERLRSADFGFSQERAEQTARRAFSIGERRPSAPGARAGACIVRYNPDGNLYSLRDTR